MKKGTASKQPPRGWLRLLLRLPIWFYQAGLGWLLGSHFLHLTHIGRRSGQPREVVLEVVGREQDAGIFYVVSGFGPRADWLLNVQQTPRVEVQVGRQRFVAQARVLSVAEAEALLRHYYRRHPLTARMLARVLGYDVVSSETDFAALAVDMPAVSLRRQ